MAARRNGNRLHQHGNRSDLVTATKAAIQEMIDFLVSEKLTPHQAYQLVSISGNVAITQPWTSPMWGARQAAEDIFVGRCSWVYAFFMPLR